MQIPAIKVDGKKETVHFNTYFNLREKYNNKIKSKNTMIWCVG